MQNFIRWIKAIYGWMRRAPITHHYWRSIAVVVATVVWVGACGWSEKSFRLAGTFLQLLGVLTVAWGILKTRADFGQPTIRSQFKAWVKVFPRLHPPAMTASINAKFPGLTFEAYGYSTHGPAADQTVEGRLEHLESIVKELEILQGTTHTAVLRAEKKAQEALNVQARQLSGEIDAVAKKIESTAMGGIHVSAVGVVLLFAGTIFGGAAAELHQLLTV